MDTAADPLLGLNLNGWTLCRCLQYTPSSCLYLAEKSGQKRIVELLLFAEGCEGLSDLVESVRRWEHPVLQKIFGIWQAENYWVLELEWVEGASPVGVVEPQTALRWMKQVAESLENPHAAGLSHGELSPENLLIQADGSLKLCGLASALVRRATESESRCGAPFCMAPEVWNGALPTPASDVFSLGALLATFLLGTPPFGDTPPNERKRLPPLALPPSVEAAVEAAVNPDPLERPRDGAAFARRLTAIARQGAPSQGGVQASHQPRGVRAIPRPRPQQQDFRPILVLTVLGILGGLLLGKWLMPRKIEAVEESASVAMVANENNASMTTAALEPLPVEAPPVEPPPTETPPAEAPSAAPPPETKPEPAPAAVATPGPSRATLPVTRSGRKSRKTTRFSFVSGPLPVSAALSCRGYRKSHVVVNGSVTFTSVPAGRCELKVQASLPGKTRIKTGKSYRCGVGASGLWCK